MSIDFKGKRSPKLIEALSQYKLVEVDQILTSSNNAAAQSVIDSWVEPMPTLTNSQYTWFLVYTGIQAVLNTRVSQLTGANAANLATWFKCGRTYEQTYTKLQNIKTELLVIAPTLVLTNSALKNAWTLASNQSLEV